MANHNVPDQWDQGWDPQYGGYYPNQHQHQHQHQQFHPGYGQQYGYPGQYGAPQQQWGVPQQQWGAPEQQWGNASGYAPQHAGGRGGYAAPAAQTQYQPRNAPVRGTLPAQQYTPTAAPQPAAKPAAKAAKPAAKKEDLANFWGARNTAGATSAAGGVSLSLSTAPKPSTSATAVAAGAPSTPTTPAAVVAVTVDTKPSVEPTPVPVKTVEAEPPAADSAPVTSSPTTPAVASTAAAAAAAAPAEQREDADTSEDKKKATGPVTKGKRKALDEYKRDPRPHLNIIFCGHVDAGKSTICGNILVKTRQVDERTLSRLRDAAKAKNRESWVFAYILDDTEAERDRGKTWETATCYFETEERRFTILDAPGHNAFVPSMIGGAAQADACVMVISSRQNEFETGFERGGQTREHFLLVKTCGVKHVICVVNKMDDCEWSKERFDQIVDSVSPYLKEVGFRKEQIFFIPISGLLGYGFDERIPSNVCEWASEHPSLFEVLHQLPQVGGSEKDPVRLPIAGHYKDDGKVFLNGKLESGCFAVGDDLIILPSKRRVTVTQIVCDKADLPNALPNENVHVCVRGVDDGEFRNGECLCELEKPMDVTQYFLADIIILEVPNIISAGSRVVMHVHTAQEEVEFQTLIEKKDKITNAVEKTPAFARANDQLKARMMLANPLCMTTFKDFNKIGRFILRSEGKTIGVGVVTKLYPGLTKEKVAAREGGL